MVDSHLSKVADRLHHLERALDALLRGHSTQEFDHPPVDVGSGVLQVGPLERSIGVEREFGHGWPDCTPRLCDPTGERRRVTGCAL